VVAAGVIGLGLIAYPQMMKYKYDEKLSLGSVMAGGTLGQLIPPSLNMVIYGAITGVSVSQLFAGGMFAGVFLAAIFIIYILIRADMNNDPATADKKKNRAKMMETLVALKSILLPGILLLGLQRVALTDAATPTECAAGGVLEPF